MNIKLWKRKVDKLSFYRDLSKGGSLKFDFIERSSGAMNWNSIFKIASKFVGFSP